MKIISKKEWEKTEQMLVNLQMDLNDAKKDNALYKEQVEYLQKKLGVEKENNKKLANLYTELEVNLTSQKLLIKNLKALLTKNGVDYSKLVNKKKVK